MNGRRSAKPIPDSPALQQLIAESREAEKARKSSYADEGDGVDGPEIRALVDKALRNGKSAPRKHHVVPASYLRRWAEDNQIRVTNVDEKRSWLTAAEKAARITDFYSMASEDLDPNKFPPLFAETQLSEIEAIGKKAIDEVLHQSPLDGEYGSKDDLAVFLGFQHVRGTWSRERSKAITQESFLMQYGDISDKVLRSLLKDGGAAPTQKQFDETKDYIARVRDGSVQIEQQTPAAIAQSFLAAVPVAEELYKRHWVVYRTPRVLITCDEPVVPIGGPGTARERKSGVADAWVVIFPLAPNVLLAMFKYAPPHHWLTDLSAAELVEINHEILANSHRLAFEVPGRRLSQSLSVPLMSSTLKVTEHPIEGKGSRSLVSFHSPSRWDNSGEPPPRWPVERWYRFT